MRFLKQAHVLAVQTRGLASSNVLLKDGLIVGVYTRKNGTKDQPEIESEEPIKGTPLFHKYDNTLRNKLSQILKKGPSLKTGEARKLYNIAPEFQIVSVVGLGPEDASTNPIECLDEKSENIRLATSAGIQSMYQCGLENVTVDVTDRPAASAEGATLGSWKYKEADRKKFPMKIKPSEQSGKWNVGMTMANCQNFARHLMDSPANLMTPTDFAQAVTNKFEKLNGNVCVKVFDKAWAKSEKMNAFLAVAMGSDEPPKFVKISYKSNKSTEENPLVLVGKGVTFDSGGISIKPSQSMDEMRADMGGAATVASSILAAAQMDLPVNVIGLIPLCENMPSAKACKPGDVVTARDGTTIQVDNTDAEGRLLLADALCYAQDLKPSAVLNVATLTGGIVVALGAAASGAFTNNDNLWEQMQKASVTTGDRVWRMPVFDFYTKQVKPAHLADINNVGRGGRGGAACTAAAFLRHFIRKDTKWMHLDIAGTMTNNPKDCSYLGSGMSGRPTRTLAEFIRNYKSDC